MPDETGSDAYVHLAGAGAAFFALTAFTPYQDKIAEQDARAYKAHRPGVALLCGSNDPQKNLLWQANGKMTGKTRL